MVYGWWNLASKDQTDAESCVSRMLVRRYLSHMSWPTVTTNFFGGAIILFWSIVDEESWWKTIHVSLNVDDYDPCRKNWHWIMGMFICFVFPNSCSELWGHPHVHHIVSLLDSICTYFLEDATCNLMTYGLVLSQLCQCFHINQLALMIPAGVTWWIQYFLQSRPSLTNQGKTCLSLLSSYTYINII